MKSAAHSENEYRIARNDTHEVRVRDRRILFHIPTTALFELDAESAAILDAFSDDTYRGTAALRTALPTYDASIDGTVDELYQLGVLERRGDEPTTHDPGAGVFASIPLSTLVLNVNTGCNLSCTYCYKEDLTSPAKGVRLELETACAGVDHLLRESPAGARVDLVFFGGEPLTNMPLIRKVVDYADEQAAACGKSAQFSLTTNATLLGEELIDYFDAHRFGITVSMDGPKATHDRNRRSVGGSGTYDVVAERARRLLSRYRSRPVGARVTLSHGSTDVVAIHQHLRDELGFFEVGFAPATSPDDPRVQLQPDELAQVFQGMKTLGRRYRDEALAGRNNGFANLHQLMTDLALGHSRTLPCGAGAGLLALDHEGDFHLCHRFTGSSVPTLGNVRDGIDRQQLGDFLVRAADPDPRGCAECHIRNLCAGGCYHESYSRSGDLLAPTAHYCDHLRDWIDFGIEIFTEISAGNPDFFALHLAPRRPLP